MSKLTIKRQTQTNRRFFEDLGEGTQLEMVLVTGGSFNMGSPDDEVRHESAESPQHNVTVSTFFMGRYPVTQAQWKQVVGFDAINQDLRTNPSRFKGDLRPVEQISWHDAVEFCDRLSQRTGRLYRLPSEAEWEYACRAGTTTPFHVGGTISAELSNYCATETYGRGAVGEYRQETTPVDHFNAPNAFGLLDMHGNVWEWCQDPWHENYTGAPVDGSVWMKDGDNKYRVRRGGSWYDFPRMCRSAFRLRINPDVRGNSIGFRVVCAVSRPQGFPQGGLR